MKNRYKIILIAICGYFGIFLVPVTASNVYCDFISQEMCTSRITGVVLPQLNLIMPSLPSDDCLVDNDGVMEPCYNKAGLLSGRFLLAWKNILKEIVMSNVLMLENSLLALVIEQHVLIKMLSM